MKANPAMTCIYPGKDLFYIMNCALLRQQNPVRQLRCGRNAHTDLNGETEQHGHNGIADIKRWQLLGCCRDTVKGNAGFASVESSVVHPAQPDIFPVG